MKILSALFPIILALFLGYILGKILPKKIKDKLIKSIAPLVWFMLFLLGFEFGEIVFSAQSLAKVMKNSIIFSLLTTFIPVILLLFLKEFKEEKIHKKLSLKALVPVLKETAIALGMCFFGALLFLLQAKAGYEISLFEVSDLLLLLILLVGIDLTYVKLDKAYLSKDILLVPCLVIVGSLLAAILASYLCGEDLKLSLALSSGFGWFTLSSVVIGDAYGSEYGTMALLIDLFRELIAITLLYSIGEKHPKIAIGSAGATALDSTLPIIKQTCSTKTIPLALFSGFLLTILAPFFITIFIP